MGYVDIGHGVKVKGSGAGTAADPFVPEAGTRKGAPALSAAAPTAAATLLLAANASRARALLVNNGAQTVYLGADNTVTTATGLPLAAGASLEDDASTGAWYGVTASGTGDVRVLEVS